jgi:small GTP-binding protein
MKKSKNLKFKQFGDESMEFNKKIAVIGEGGVGKTTMMLRYINGKFSDTTKMTVGSDFFTKKIIRKDMIGKLLIWDLGGQKRFRPMMKGYLSGVEGIILVYDLSRIITLLKLDNWIDNLEKMNIPLDGSLPIILVGTKKDLYSFPADLEVQRLEKISEVKKRVAIAYQVENSSLTNENIDNAFNYLLKHFIIQTLKKNLCVDDLLDSIVNQYI